MRKIGVFLGGLLLFLIAYSLLLPLTFLNFVVVAWKYKDLNYFKQTAVNMDKFGNREFRTLFNATLIKNNSNYLFGSNREDTISAVLGHNQVSGTLTTTGRILVWILDKIEKDHCLKAITHL